MDVIPDDKNMGNDFAVKEKHTFKIKGVWTPAMIFFDEDLTDADKRIFTIIDLLDGKNGCYATNKYIGTILNYSTRTITTGISRLLDKGFILRGKAQPSQFRSAIRTLKVSSKAHKYRSPSQVEGRNTVLPQGRSTLPVDKEASFYQINKNDKQELKPESKDSVFILSEQNAEDGDFSPKEDNNLDLLTEPSKSTLIKEQCAEHRNKPLVITKVAPYECSKKVKPFIDYWMNTLGRTYRKNSVYKQDCVALHNMIHGTFFNKKETASIKQGYDGYILTFDDWKIAIDMFNTMRSNLDYYPKDKKVLKSLNVAKFLYSRFSKVDMKSQFIICLETKPQLISSAIKYKDPNPEITQLLITKCSDTFGWDLDNGNRNIAIKCIDKLNIFFESNKDKIQLYDMHYKWPHQRIGFLIEMFEKRNSAEYPVKPHYLISAPTYDTYLFAHLKHVGSLKS
jgi:hypothetical protein